jgi:hypothetical protein
MTNTDRRVSTARRFFLHPNDPARAIVVIEHLDSDGAMIDYDHVATKSLAAVPGYHGLSDSQREDVLEGRSATVHDRRAPIAGSYAACGQG